MKRKSSSIARWPKGAALCLSLCLLLTGQTARPQIPVTDGLVLAQVVTGNQTQLAQFLNAVEQLQVLLQNLQALANANWSNPQQIMGDVVGIVNDAGQIASNSATTAGAYAKVYQQYSAMQSAPPAPANYQSNYSNWATNTYTALQKTVAATNKTIASASQDQARITKLQKQAEAAKGEKSALDATNAALIEIASQIAALKQIISLDINGKNLYAAQLAEQSATQQANMTYEMNHLTVAPMSSAPSHGVSVVPPGQQ